MSYQPQLHLISIRDVDSAPEGHSGAMWRGLILRLTDPAVLTRAGRSCSTIMRQLWRRRSSGVPGCWSSSERQPGRRGCELLCCASLSRGEHTQNPTSHAKIRMLQTHPKT